MSHNIGLGKPFIFYTSLVLLAVGLITSSAKSALNTTSALLGNTQEVASSVASSCSEKADYQSCALSIGGSQLLTLGFDKIANALGLQNAMRIKNEMRFVSGDGLVGDLDAVIPLAGFSAGKADGANYALFLQSGITRWSDSSIVRDDVRFGGVLRFYVSDNKASALGLISFFQTNLNAGHQRVVLGADYIGKLGGSTFSYYYPVSDWKQGAHNTIQDIDYQERPMEGMEFKANLNLTSTMKLEGNVSQWQSDNFGANHSLVQAGVGMDWQPHRFLNFKAEWQHIERDDLISKQGITTEQPVTFSARIKLPLQAGKIHATPKDFALANLEPFGEMSLSNGVADIWQAADVEGKIRYSKRGSAPSAVSKGNVSVIFENTQASTGGQFVLVASTPHQANRDYQVSIRLQGTGANPAIAGEDFVDEVYTITIKKGQDSGKTAVRILDNPNIKQKRSIAIKIDEVI